MGLSEQPRPGSLLFSFYTLASHISSRSIPFRLCDQTLDRLCKQGFKLSTLFQSGIELGWVANRAPSHFPIPIGRSHDHGRLRSLLAALVHRTISLFGTHNPIVFTIRFPCRTISILRHHIIILIVGGRRRILIILSYFSFNEEILILLSL